MTAPKTRTRDRILDAAFALFVERGLDGTSISDVERQVGLTPGTGSFYRHFPSKEALLRAVIEREVEHRMEHISAGWDAVPVPEDPEQAMLVTAQLTLAAMRHFAPLFRLLLAEGDRNPNLSETIAQALLGSRAVGGWVESPATFLGVAAVMGYYVFELFGAERLHLPDEDAFLRAVVAASPLPLPPMGPAPGR